jgi:hypothetical protein
MTQRPRTPSLLLTPDLRLVIELAPDWCQWIIQQRNKSGWKGIWFSLSPADIATGVHQLHLPIDPAAAKRAAERMRSDCCHRRTVPDADQE